MKRSPIRVFISSRTSESSNERRAAADAITQLARDGYPFVDIRAEEMPATVGSPQHACLEWVRASDVFLGIFGTEISGPVLEEYEEALLISKPCLIFCQECDRAPEQQELFARIREWKPGQFVQQFDNPDKIKHEVYRALQKFVETFKPLYLKRLMEDLRQLPLLPLERGAISIEDLSPRLLVEKKERLAKPNDEERTQWFSMEEVLDLHQRWILLGPGGSGKTLTLRSLTYHLAKRGFQGGHHNGEGLWIPVLLRLNAYRGDLLEQVVIALGAGGLRCDAALAWNWICHERVVLLLDGFDEVRDPRRLISELEDFDRLSPHLRLIIASRSTTKGLTSLSYPSFELLQLADAGMARLFAAHLGQERGNDLFRTLLSANLLDPFRQPLMAWFAALAYRRGTDPILPSRGMLYRRVIESDWLAAWEEARTCELPASSLQLRIECLAVLGYAMVKRNEQCLHAREAERLCCDMLRKNNESLSANDLLIELCEIRLIEKSDQGFIFWHPSFRDYFAAVWLERHFLVARISLLAWSARWHEPLIFLIGLLDDARAASVLRHLFLLAKPTMKFVESGLRYPWAANRLFLLLRCLVNAANNHEAQKNRFIDLITSTPEEHFYLGFASISIYSPHIGGVEKPYAQFYTYVGELRTPKSFEFLLRSVRRRYRVLGLARSGHPGTMTALLDGFRQAEENDFLADKLTAVMLLTFPQEDLLREIQIFFQTADRDARRRLVRAIVIATPSAGSDHVERPALPNAIAWIDFLTQVYLYEEDRDICKNVQTLLSRMEGHMFSLPERSETAFLATLAKGEPSVRSKMIYVLFYSQSTRSLEALIRSIDDPDPVVRVSALDVLSYRDMERFPTHVALVIEIELLSDSSIRDKVEVLLSTIRTRLAEEGVADASVLALAPTLALGACAARASLRMLSIKALVRLKLKQVTPVLEHIFRNDGIASVRSEALTALTWLLKDGVEPYLEEGFEDAAPSVRKMAAWLAFYVSSELLARLAPRLEKLVADPDEDVRQKARISLLRCEDNARRKE